MKPDPSLRKLYAGAGPSRTRLSREVLTPLLIAAGMVGLPVILGVAQCSRNEADDDTPQTVNADTSYPNNHFLPGAGYYHAPYHGWFMFPFNHYESGRGWYRGGVWRSAAQAGLDEQNEIARTGGNGARGGAPGLNALARQQSSQPTPEAVMRANAASKAHAGSVIRGGFGHSSRPAIS